MDGGFAGVAAECLNTSGAVPPLQRVAAAPTVGAGLAQSSQAATIPPTDTLKITKLETSLSSPVGCSSQVHTDNGLVGPGEPIR